MIQWQGYSQERQDNAWKALFVDYSLTNSRTLRLENHVRTRQFFAENDQYLLRPSISFKLSKHTAFTTGVTFFLPIHPFTERLKIIFGNNLIFLSR